MQLNDQENDELRRSARQTGNIDPRGPAYILQFMKHLQPVLTHSQLSSKIEFPTVHALVDDLPKRMVDCYHVLRYDDGDFPRRFPYIFICLLKNIVFYQAGIAIGQHTFSGWLRHLEIWSVADVKYDFLLEEDDPIRKALSQSSGIGENATCLTLQHCNFMISKEEERLHNENSYVFLLFKRLVRKIIPTAVTPSRTASAGSAFDLYETVLRSAREKVEYVCNSMKAFSNDDEIGPHQLVALSCSEADIVAACLCETVRSTLEQKVPSKLINLDTLRSSRSLFMPFIEDVFNFFHYDRCSEPRIREVFEAIHVVSQDPPSVKHVSPPAGVKSHNFFAGRSDIDPSVTTFDMPPLCLLKKTTDVPKCLPWSSGVTSYFVQYHVKRLRDLMEGGTTDRDDTVSHDTSFRYFANAVRPAFLERYAGFETISVDE